MASMTLRTAIVQAVALTCLLLAQATSPERCCAAPAGTDIVGHVELMLYEVGVRPDDGVIVGDHLGTRLSHVSLAGGIDPDIILHDGPGRTVAGCATHLIEEFLTTLYLLAVEVTGLRNTQTTMPDAELIEALVSHLFLTAPGSSCQRNICDK